MIQLILRALWVFSPNFLGQQPRVARAHGHGDADHLVDLGVAGLEFLEHAEGYFVQNSQPAPSAAPRQIRWRVFRSSAPSGP